MQSRSVVAAVALLVVVGAAPGRAAAQDNAIGVRASVGFLFETGDYGFAGDRKTDIWTIPLALRIDVDSVTLSVETSWLSTRGPATAVRTDTAIMPPGASQTASGLGDTTVGLSYFHFWSEPWSARHLPDFEMRATVKIPTADQDKLLGTGEVDFALQVELSKQLGFTTVFASGGYRFAGGPLRASLPGGGTLQIHLENAWLASAGVTVDLSHRGERWCGLMLGLAYDFRESSVPGVADEHELSPYAQVDLGSAVALSPYLVIGLSKNSPDIGVGSQLTFRY